MSEIKDGGPAFPIPISCDAGGGIQESRFAGMSLRDWFAGMALCGDLGFGIGPDNRPPVKAAKAAYAYADAMIAERENGK